MVKLKCITIKVRLCYIEMHSFKTFISKDRDQLRNAVSSYIAYTGGRNNKLRETPNHPDWISPNLDSNMKPIQAKSKKLYRGISHGAINISKLNVGDTLVDHGYMSTSSNPGSAGSFGYLGIKIDQPAIHFHITAPQGTRSVSVKQALRGYSAFNKAENEHILARGTHLKVDKIKHVPSNGLSHPAYHIHATVVHQEN